MKYEKYEESIECCNQILKIDSKQIDAYLLKGNIQKKFNKFENAIKSFDNVNTINSSNIEAQINKG